MMSGSAMMMPANSSTLPSGFSSMMTMTAASMTGPTSSALTTGIGGGNGGGGQGSGGGAGGEIPNANAGTQAHGTTLNTVATSSRKGGAAPTVGANARAMAAGVAGLLGGLVL